MNCYYPSFRSLLLSLAIVLPMCLFGQGSSNMTLLGTWDNDLLPNTGPTFFFNDIWGYHHDNGTEVAIVGSVAFTHFIDVTDPYNPAVIDSFAGGHSSATHRDFKTYSHYAYGVCDQGNSTSSLQIFDLQYLPDSVTKVYDSQAFFTRAHNIFIDTAAARLYVVGGNASPSGVMILDLSVDPANPTLLADHDQGRYTHDIYVRNDTGYHCNGNAGLYIWDYTDPLLPNLLGSLTTYTDKGYNHAAWLNPAGTHIAMADETKNKRIKMVDVTDPAGMSVTSLFESDLLAPVDTQSMAHNPFIYGNYAVISYYEDGVQVFDVSDPASPFRAGYYDTDDYSTNYGGYDGCWGVYPFLPSGLILGLDENHGLFVMHTNFAYPYPMASSISKTDITCHGGADGTVALDASGGSAPYTYAWSNGATTPTLAGLTAGTYSVFIRDRWGNGFNDTITLTEPMPMMSTGAVTEESCSGDDDGAIELSVTGDPGTLSYSFLWGTGETTQDLVGVAAGMYEVTITNDVGCTIADTFEVTVAFLTPTAEAGSDTTHCGDPLTLNATNPVLGFGTWSVGSGSAILDDNGDPNSEAFGFGAGLNSFIWTVENGPCIAEDTVTYDIAFGPTSAFSFSTVLADVSFVDGSADAVTYDWDFGDGMSSTAASPSHSYLASGVYTVCLTTTNDCGSDVVCDSVNVSITSVFGDLNNGSIHVYPNPTDGHFFLENPSISEGWLEVTSLTGALVKRERILNVGKMELDLSSEPEGIYMLKLIGNGLSARGKIAVYH